MQDFHLKSIWRQKERKLTPHINKNKQTNKQTKKFFY